MEFFDWLKFHKEKWDIQKLQRKGRNRHLSRLDKQLSQIPSSRGNMATFLRQRNVDLIELPWQIIQVMNTCTLEAEYNVTVVE